ncbi:MAG TPA: hypothetical protein VM286_06850 [Candidatus Thermoplasmatota archaeon]|nr:hypothetical protein [Candidatus Thermoplasmatota archaeon]
MPVSSAPPGPWYALGMGGQLLATNALAFGLVVAVTYLAGFALLGALVSLLWLMLFGLCWPCGSVSATCSGPDCGPSPQGCCPCNGPASGSSGGGCCSGSASGSTGGSGCCSGSASGSGSAGGGGCCSSSTSGSVGTTGSGGVSVKATAAGPAGAATLLAGSAWWRARPAPGGLRDTFAHHPDAPAFAQDVFEAWGLRLCVGCATVAPSFLFLSAWLALAPLPTWWMGLAAGVPLALVQAVSSAGHARRRWQKAAVKASLGLGLALVVSGVLASPWPRAAKVALLLALMGLSWLSTLPRRRRLDAWAAEQRSSTAQQP